MFGGNASILIGKGDGVGRGRSAASASLLAAKAELPGTLDAMLSEEWEASHRSRPPSVALLSCRLDCVLGVLGGGEAGVL